MPHKLDSFLYTPPIAYSSDSIGLKLAMLVIVIHLGLLGIGILKTSTPPPPVRNKVAVQTIHLIPFQPPTIQTPASLPDQILTPISIEEPPPALVASPSKPSSVKIDPQPQTKVSPPKSIVQETKKKIPAKKTPAPVKKVSEPVKKSIPTETIKPKPADESKKKQQQEQAEVEKKRKQEQAEFEKKQKRELEAAQANVQKRKQALEEQFARLDKTRHQTTIDSSSNVETITLPKELGTLQIDALPIPEIGHTGDWGTQEMGYLDQITSRLKKTLQLPDYGAVALKLTLNRVGKVIKIEIVQSESSKNKAYIERELPKIVFPPFNQQFQGVSQYIFSITFQNDS